ncbi:MAG: hypothetical protein IJK04_05630 [Kiritimatiellae bacterium]|nr:hypothetical protein [Kiritimatiellia bacterium]
MKNNKATRKAWRRSICVAGQIFNLIPPRMIGELAQRFAIHSRTFDERSHVFALLLCQVAHGTAYRVKSTISTPFQHRPFPKSPFFNASTPQGCWTSCVEGGGFLQAMGW